MRPNRGGERSVPPGDGPYSDEYIEVVGGPDYVMPMPPTKTRAPIHRAGNGDSGSGTGAVGPSLDPTTLPTAGCSY